MVEHAGEAHLTLSRGGIYIPAMQDAFAAALRAPTKEERVRLDRKLVHIVERPLAAAAGMLGYGLHDRQKMELFEYLLRGGMIAGGQAVGDYLEAQILRHFFRNTAIVAPPASVDIHLYTTATNDANSSGTEVTGGSYAPQSVGTTSGWTDPGATGGLTDNAAEINFGTATASWGTLSHTSVEMPGSANRLFHGALTASKNVANGDTFKFLAGGFDISIA